MARFITDLSKFDYQNFEATTLPTGRTYHTPAGDAPSVTTILSSLPNPELDAWRERVGEEEANRISKEATDIGNYMHDMLEFTLTGREFVRDGSALEKMAAEMFNAVRLLGWRHLDEVWGVEVPLHFQTLYAGRTDLVGKFKSKRSIMDYKTSKFPKPPEHLVKYKLQLAAYSMAHEAMYPEMEIEQGVLFFAMRPNPEYKVRAKSQVITVDAVELFDYQQQWVEVVDNYYA